MLTASEAVWHSNASTPENFTELRGPSALAISVVVLNLAFSTRGALLPFAESGGKWQVVGREREFGRNFDEVRDVQ